MAPPGPARLPSRVGQRNALFQQWQSLLTNRTARQRSASYLVQGVRPVTLAVRLGLPLRAVLRLAAADSSAWARETAAAAGASAPVVDLAPELLAELGGRDDDAPPELVLVAELPPDDLRRVRFDAGPVLVVDRPASPGNLGTLVRSADAFGAGGVVVTGHAADPYDPRAVRAATGSLSAVPVVRADSAAVVLDHLAVLRRSGTGVRVVGTDETGRLPVGDADLAGPLALVVGSETSGMSRAWLAACEQVVAIPIGGSASSLNAAVAGSLVLYEAARQRAAR